MSSSLRRCSSIHGASSPARNFLTAMCWATRAGPQASDHSLRLVSVSARCRASAAASESIQEPSRRRSWSWLLPFSRSGPRRRRSLDRSARDRGVDRGWRSFSTECVGKLAACDRLGAVRYQVGEEQSPLPPRQGVLDPPPIHFGDETPAELDARGRLQSFPKLTARCLSHNCLVLPGERRGVAQANQL
jgi:hypothetical protein